MSRDRSEAAGEMVEIEDGTRIGVVQRSR